MIGDWASEAYRNEQLLSGIIYLNPITHTRMEGSIIKNLRTLQSLCGQEALENVLLTTTQWSRVNWVEGEFRENRLRVRELWGGLIEKGATLQRFTDTRESGLELIHRLMLNKPKPLHIQNQMVKEQMTLLETDAGKCINEVLVAQKKHKEELESLVRERQEAIKAKDEMKETLAAEQAKAREKLEEAAAERRLLEELYAEEVEKRETEEKKRREEMGKLERSVIEFPHDTIGRLTTGKLVSYGFKRKFVSGINDHEEFKSKAFEIGISFEPTPTSVLGTSDRTAGEMSNISVVSTKHIALRYDITACLVLPEE